MIGERVAKVESEVVNIKDSVSDIRSKIEVIGESVIQIDKGITKLALIAEQNQRIQPRMIELEKKVARYGGSIAAACIGLSLFSNEIRTIIGA